MIAVLSPSKTLNFDKTNIEEHSEARLLDKTDKLINKLSKMSKPKLQELMSISENLAKLNYDRYRSYEKHHILNDNAKQAILAFTGDVYTGFKVSSLDNSDLSYAQKHIRILSGLYGILRPLDLIQAYRLEMGTKLKIYYDDNLYEFWGNTLTELLNEDLQNIDSKLLINLASVEYFNALNVEKLNASIVDVDFREWRDGELKFITFNAKKARGMMARYIVQARCATVDDLKSFDLDGYQYDKTRSSENSLMFTKEN